MRENPGRAARATSKGFFECDRKIASAQERRDLRLAFSTTPSVWRPLAVAALVTLLVTLLSYALPRSWTATGVGFAFLLSTYWLVLRTDDPAQIREFGLSLGGLLEPTPLDGRRLLRDALGALATALVAAALIFPVFWLGFRIWWRVEAFEPAPLWPAVAGALDEILVIALPEEAFFRGYLQTSLDKALGKPRRIAGVQLGAGLVIASAIFAVGHLLTELNPSRLAVFFPALVFGLLRARTGGIGAAVVFHALCNVFASYLLRSYGLAR